MNSGLFQTIMTSVSPYKAINNHEITNIEYVKWLTKPENSKELKSRIIKWANEKNMPKINKQKNSQKTDNQYYQDDFIRWYSGLNQEPTNVHSNHSHSKRIKKYFSNRYKVFTKTYEFRDINGSSTCVVGDNAYFLKTCKNPAIIYALQQAIFNSRNKNIEVNSNNTEKKPHTEYRCDSEFKDDLIKKKIDKLIEESRQNTTILKVVESRKKQDMFNTIQRSLRNQEGNRWSPYLLDNDGIKPKNDIHRYEVSLYTQRQE